MLHKVNNKIVSNVKLYSVSRSRLVQVANYGREWGVLSLRQISTRQIQITGRERLWDVVRVIVRDRVLDRDMVSIEILRIK